MAARCCCEAQPKAAEECVDVYFSGQAPGANSQNARQVSAHERHLSAPGGSRSVARERDENKPEKSHEVALANDVVNGLATPRDVCKTPSEEGVRPPEGIRCSTEDAAFPGQQSLDGIRSSDVSLFGVFGTRDRDPSFAGRCSEITMILRRSSLKEMPCAVLDATVGRPGGQFLWEMTSRISIIFVVMMIVGILVGHLFNRGAGHLLQKAERSAWRQPWNETRVQDLGGTVNAQTYVMVFAPRHRYSALDPTAPKFSQLWIWVYYLQTWVKQSIGYGSPWFIMCAIHGFGTMWRYVATFYTPYVVALFAWACVSALYAVSAGAKIISQEVELCCLGILFVIEAFIIVPFTARRAGLSHPVKIVLVPFVLQYVGLGVLTMLMPLVMELLDDWGKALVRVTLYSCISEAFVACARIACRLVPLADSDQYRPEDKVFAVIPLDCLFGYWGRIILMDLVDPAPIIVVNVANLVIDFVQRITVVQRDKAYLFWTVRSATKGSLYWKANADGMVRFRCANIMSHLLLEYVMIATAASFYWFAGIARSYEEHAFNVGIQLLCELLLDGVTLYVEIARHNLPLLQAWFNRQKHFGQVFCLFVVGFTLFAISQTGDYFCAMRSPDDAGVMLMYCGRSKK